MLMDVFHPEFFNKVFNELMQDVNLPNSQNFDFTPKAEIVKNETNFTVKVSLPGAKKEDLKLSFDKNLLTVSGEKKSEHEENKNNVLRSEFHYGKFSRTFKIDAEIDKDNINAEFLDGILKITLPLTEKVAATTIAVK